MLSSRSNQKKIKEIKENEEKRWQELESKAQLDYQDIIESANQKAKNIILDANQIKEETSTNFQTSVSTLFENQKDILENTSLALTKKYEEQINQINKNNIQILTNIYKDIELNANSNFEKYKEVIQKQTFDAEKIAHDRIKDQYQKIENEIEEHKKQMLQKIDDDIYKILLNISKLVIGGSLDLSKHEDLIIKSLEEAKKENRS